MALLTREDVRAFPSSGPSRFGMFRFRRLNGKVLLTNDVGDFVLLAPEEFRRFIRGGIDAREGIGATLYERGFLHNEVAEQRAVRKFMDRSQAWRTGPGLHIVVTTLRCNQSCGYCHATAVPANEKDFDMDLDTARKVVDTIFKTPNRNIVIEFQGGEPLVNFEVVRFIVDYGLEKNKTIDKNLVFTVVTNLTAISDEKLEFLVDRKVGLCTSLDGPRDVHERNRGPNTYDRVVKWLKRAQEVYSQKYPLYRPAALMTTTRYSLAHPEAIIDEYIGFGLEGIHLRALDPLGFGKNDWRKLGYTPEDFLTFYRRAVDYILTINKDKQFFFERMAAVYMAKVLTDSDPNYMDLRSPTGAGIGVLTYHYNGDVYANDEGRMLAMMGDDAFRIGSVHDQSFTDLVLSPVVRSLVMASVNDSHPGCSTCAYKPYCGINLWLNYGEQGNIYGRQYDNPHCRISMGICDYLFEKIQDADNHRIFSDWVQEGIRL